MAKNDFFKKSPHRFSIWHWGSIVLKFQVRRSNGVAKKSGWTDKQTDRQTSKNMSKPMEVPTFSAQTGRWLDQWWVDQWER